MENNKVSVEEYEKNYNLIKKYVENRRDAVFKYMYESFAERIGEETTDNYCKFLETLSDEGIAAACVTQMMIGSCIEMYEDVIEKITKK